MFHGRFYGLQYFQRKITQFCPSTANAEWRIPAGSNDMQSSETLRNSLGLNYESPALTAELQAHFHM